MPGVAELRVGVGADAADVEIGIRLAGVDEKIVVFATAPAVEQVQAQFQGLAGNMTEAQAYAFVAIRIVIGVGWIRLAGCVDAGAFFKASSKVEAGAFISPR
ncbi:hypothetical protein D3C77_510260 [compost metagenome]